MESCNTLCITDDQLHPRMECRKSFFDKTLDMRRDLDHLSTICGHVRPVSDPDGNGLQIFELQEIVRHTSPVNVGERGSGLVQPHSLGKHWFNAYSLERWAFACSR